MGDKGIKISIIEKLFISDSSKNMLFHAFAVFKPSKSNIISLIVLFLFSLVPAAIISCGENTVSSFLVSVDLALNVMLGLFGIIFTGYAIFQAILNEKLLIKMLQETKGEGDKEESLLQLSNESFVGLMLLTIFGIIVSFFLKLILGGIEVEFSLFSSEFVNESCSAVLCTIYFFFNAVVIWEMKSFVFNIFQLFNAYSGARIIEILEKSPKV